MDKFSPKFAALSNTAYELAKELGVADRIEEFVTFAADWFSLTDRLEFVDVGETMRREIIMPTPEIGRIQGRDTGLFYEGSVNMVFGEDGIGKTLCLQAIVANEIMNNQKVMWLELEMPSEEALALKLQQMRINKPEHVSEDLAWAHISRPLSLENRDMLVNVARGRRLVVIDSFGELLAKHGRDENKDADVRWANDFLLTPLAETGAAVVVIDHISKTNHGGPSSTAKGSTTKRSIVTGIALNIWVRVEEKKGDQPEYNEYWTRSSSGVAILTCHKDKHGTYKRRETIAYMEVQPTPAELSISFLRDDPLSPLTEEQPLDQQERVYDPATRRINGKNAMSSDKITSDEIEAAIMQILEESPLPLSVLNIQLMLPAFVPMEKKELQRCVDRLVSQGFVVYDSVAKGYIATITQQT